MALYLHNPASNAHLEELRDRLSTQLARLPREPGAAGEGGNVALIQSLVEVVRAMDRGAISPRDALDVFARHRIPGFSFGRWLVDMVDEGVYLEGIYNEAA